MKDRTAQSERRDVATPVCLPRQMIDDLDAQANREGIYSRSAIIRRACREYLDRHSNQYGLTGQEAA